MGPLPTALLIPFQEAAWQLSAKTVPLSEQASDWRNPQQCRKAIILVRLGGFGQFPNKKQKETRQLTLY